MALGVMIGCATQARSSLLGSESHMGCEKVDWMISAKRRVVQSSASHLRGATHFLPTTLHNRNFLFRQAVELVDDLVDEGVRAHNARPREGQFRGEFL